MSHLDIMIWHQLWTWGNYDGCNAQDMGYSHFWPSEAPDPILWNMKSWSLNRLFYTGKRTIPAVPLYPETYTLYLSVSLLIRKSEYRAYFQTPSQLSIKIRSSCLPSFVNSNRASLPEIRIIDLSKQNLNQMVLIFLLKTNQRFTEDEYNSPSLYSHHACCIVNLFAENGSLHVLAWEGEYTLSILRINWVIKP